MILAVFALGGLSFALLARRLVPKLGESGLCQLGCVLIAIALAAICLKPTPGVGVIGCYLFGLGFYMLHNTLQTTATQMAPERRGAAVSLFATAFFTGQSLGTAVGGGIIALSGTTPTLALAAVAVLPVGFGFAWQIRRRDRSLVPA
ncbi:MFS transporter [Salinicola acroporae]|uniref:MFS transporter n=1 Tax=Salinicola acroporae TaxID=1541440 RepID=UPI0024569E68|nr:MFS transporter [Salinicola acroporae]